jgi:hypothetical protein
MAALAQHRGGMILRQLIQGRRGSEPKDPMARVDSD